MSDFIDLCSSDDEDSAALKPRPSMDNNESPRKTFVTPDIHTKNAENDDKEQRNRKKPRSLFHYFESSDDDSSDGDLYFQPFRNNQKSKAVAAKALPVSETNISTAKAKESTNEGSKMKAINPIIGKMIAPKRKTIAPTSSDTDGRYNHQHIMMILSWCYHVRIRGLAVGQITRYPLIWIKYSFPNVINYKYKRQKGLNRFARLLWTGVG